MGLGELATDPRFVPSSNLIANAAEIFANAFASHDLAHWTKGARRRTQRLGHSGDTAGNPQDPQVEPNGYVVRNVDDQGEKSESLPRPLNSNKPLPAPARAPEHRQQEEIPLELDVDWNDIARAKDLNAIL